MGVGVEEEDGVGGPAGRSEGEGDGEEVEEETDEWLITSTRPCRRRHTQVQVFSTFRNSEKRISNALFYLPSDFFSHHALGGVSLPHTDAHTIIIGALNRPSSLYPPVSLGGAVLCSW